MPSLSKQAGQRLANMPQAEHGKPRDCQLQYRYRGHVQPQHDICLEDLAARLAVIEIKRGHVPDQIDSPDAQSENPEHE